MTSACTRCAAPLPPSAAALICGKCQQHPPAFDHSWAVFPYAPPIDTLIKRLKYYKRLELAQILGQRLCELVVQRALPRPEVLLPVPLHPSRLRERGYNQSLELARIVARNTKIPIDIRSVRRIRATPPQTDLPEDQRRRNVHGAFAVRRQLDAKHITIVDDVMTTGHTVNALALCLRKAGVERIDVWVVARA